MKNYFIILTILFSFQMCAFSYDCRYIQRNLFPVYCNNGYYYPNYIINKVPYNPYQIQNNVNCASYSNPKAKRLKKVRRLQKLRDSYNNLSFLNNNNKGTLTGYSIPVTRDIYEQMGIPPYNLNGKSQNNSNIRYQELFSFPSTNGEYYQNGRKYINDGGISGQTGVKIIYD